MNTSQSVTGVRIAFATIVVAMLPAVLDQTMLATALPTISADLGRITDVSWIVTAYVVSAAASTPLWGKLGDRHGRERLLEASLILFLATSAVCGVAQAHVIDGVETVFAVAAPVAALALLVVLLLREVPLSGAQAGAPAEVRTRSPRGSNSGSAETLPATH